MDKFRHSSSIFFPPTKAELLAHSVVKECRVKLLAPDGLLYATKSFFSTVIKGVINPTIALIVPISNFESVS